VEGASEEVEEEDAGVEEPLPLREAESRSIVGLRGREEDAWEGSVSSSSASGSDSGTSTSSSRPLG
jgi:hypothetical protein